MQFNTCFDAYKVKGNVSGTEKIHNINVVVHKEDETADMYIEKSSHKIGKNIVCVLPLRITLNKLSF